MNNIFYFYKKTSEDVENIKKFLYKTNVRAKEYRFYLDTNRDFINYENMKDLMLKEKGILIINSLHSIAYNKESVIKELNWFYSNKIEIIIAEMPSTWNFDNLNLNLKCVEAMIDIFNLLQSYSNFEFQNPDFTEGGRKKIRFPENWESLYELYEAKKITANEFQQQVGLKRATFFNLLSEYKQLNKLNVDTFEAFSNSIEQIVTC